uniref:F-box domain-containing protein n=2 Tax=Panagrellus redivivus TaxID=6233 RepID=A0A7E4W2W0_PANRE
MTTGNQTLPDKLTSKLTSIFRHKRMIDEITLTTLSGTEAPSVLRDITETSPSPSISMMTTSPHLPNHLIHELINTTRLRSDGDAMVLLALSGKEPFSVFRYVIENRAIACADRSNISIQCLPFTCCTISIKFVLEGSKRLTNRFVRELHVLNPGSKQLPLEKITKLMIRRYAQPFTSILNSWTDLEVFRMCDITDGASDDFFDDFVNTSLPNLRKLDIELTLNGCNKLMTLKTPLPFPEDVGFHFIVADSGIFGSPTTFRNSLTNNALSDSASVQTFPNVKHFTATVQIWTDMTAEVLDQISAVIKCFTGAETVKIGIYHHHESRRNDIAGVVILHEWLRDTSFAIPVEVFCEELVDITAYDGPYDNVYAELKSIGYEEDCHPTRHIIEKEYGNIKLIHSIDVFGGYEFSDED